MDAIHGLFRSPWLFPKKKGKPLEDGLKEVHLVYGKENTSRFLHFTCHPVKGRIQRSALVLAFLLWLLYPRDMKLRCLALSLAYSFTERGFTFFERQVAYTSLAQFLANLLYMPVLVDLYGHFLSSSWLYVLLFPVNIWVLEIVLHPPGPCCVVVGLGPGALDLGPCHPRSLPTGWVMVS
ncbi:unnamed protein product [Effrenium voratum]|nr:unnamed protein product [Effrenium voratum]